MEPNIQFSESFARVACLAALELEQVALKQETNFEYTARFIDYITNNMNFKANASSRDVELFSVDMSTAFAMNAALGHADNTTSKSQNLFDLITIIMKQITEPLNKIINGQMDGFTGDTIQELSTLCLNISRRYSSLEYRFDVFNDHPYK